MIGKKIYKDNFNQVEYTNAVLWCKNNNAHIEDKGDYYEVVDNSDIKPIQPTLEDKLKALEIEYNMPRVLREGILSNPSAYSEFNVKRAQELEEIAEQIRRNNQ